MKSSERIPQAVLNLRKIWQQKKVEMQFTQIEAAKNLDWSQGAISQYLSNITELGPGAVVKFANFLDVDPTEIDPEVEHKLPHIHRINLAYSSDDMTRSVDEHLYSRKTDVTEYIKVSPSSKIEGSGSSVFWDVGLTGVAQICALNKYPSAKIIAVRLKNEKRLRFYHKTDAPSSDKAHKMWAVVAFTYL